MNAARVCIATMPHWPLSGERSNRQALRPGRLAWGTRHLEITRYRAAPSACRPPASIFVITGRYPAARSHEHRQALRLAPNIEVARVDSHQYAISARGFNHPMRSQNKLLVLIDGRNCLHAAVLGVFWDAQDTLLEDVDRIEVISGPGATLWGAKAVNGVIT